MKQYLYYLPHGLFYYCYKHLCRNRFKNFQLSRTEEANIKENSLHGFDQHECIFVHIPKTGGVSLSASLFGNLGGGHRPIYEYYKIYSPKEFRDYFKFAIVRNPWDRLVSGYHFLKEGGLNDKDQQWFSSNLKQYKDFEDFVLNWLSEQNKFAYIHFIPQHHYLCLREKVLVDKVYKIENMESVIKDLNRRLDTNISNTHRNKTTNRASDYRAYYNNETKKIVGRVYAKDISLFNYNF